MNILFLDIETAPEFETFEKMPEAGKVAYTKKFQYRIGPDLEFKTVQEAYEDCGLHAEFSKIVCIGLGTEMIDAKDVDYDPRNGANMIVVKTITGTEPEILNKLTAALEKMKPDALCAHNGKNFDYPFIARRYMANMMPIPAKLQTEGLKPWDLTHLMDTLDIWRQGEYKTYVSLITLAYIFGVPSPKDAIDGTMVAREFYAGRIADIALYCSKDVVTLINVYRRMRRKDIIEKIQIV